MKYLILVALLGSVAVSPAAAQEAAVVEKPAVEKLVKEEKTVTGADTDEARLVDACTAR